MKNKEKIIQAAIIGLGEGIVNTNSEEFKFLKKKIIEESRKQPSEEILQNKLLSLRFQMEDYLQEDHEILIGAEWFLKEFVNALNIKNKTFAEYIGYNESNLSALFRGKRKINIDLALKFGKIFDINPTLWIHIQSKNELIKMRRENESKYSQYSIEGLLKKVG